MISDKIKLIKDDITSLDVDVIVNAANNSLLGGGGVDGTIHKAAGPELLKECITLKHCETGKAKITKGYNLKAKYIIHAVGPIWNNENEKECTDLLTLAYYNSINIALKYNLKTIAFPNISTGVYNFPKNKAANIAINMILHNIDKINLVYFVCFDKENYQIYLKILNEPCYSCNGSGYDNKCLDTNDRIPCFICNASGKKINSMLFKTLRI